MARWLVKDIVKAKYHDDEPQRLQHQATTTPKILEHGLSLIRLDN
ncbi:MAG: hypothetical protein ACTS73_04400 [Arsenophonus sp. NEOnobi-MAG3]